MLPFATKGSLYLSSSRSLSLHKGVPFYLTMSPHHDIAAI